MQPETVADAARSQSWVQAVFGVLARPQTWLNFVYLWIAFPLGLFYFVFLVTGLSVGIGLIIVLVGVPILLLVAAAWWCLAAFERVLARRLLGADVAAAPRPWERADDIWGRIKAHVGAATTWKDLLYLFLKFPMGLISFVLCVTGLALVVAFVGAPFMQLTGQIYVAGERIDSWALAIALVPVGVLALFGWMHLLNGWAWVSRRLAEALLHGAPAEGPGPAAEPVAVPPAAVWQGPTPAAQGTTPAWQQTMPAGPHGGRPVWVMTPYGWQLVQPQPWPVRPDWSQSWPAGTTVAAIPQPPATPQPPAAQPAPPAQTLPPARAQSAQSAPAEPAADQPDTPDSTTSSEHND